MKNFKIFYRQIQEELKNTDDVTQYIDNVTHDDMAYYFEIQDKENDSKKIKVSVTITKDNLGEMNEDGLKKQISYDLKKAVQEFEEIGMRNKMSDCAMEILNYFNKNSNKIVDENYQSIVEKWTDKYKKSIDCNNPKGFSQRAHCQGRKKKD